MTDRKCHWCRTNVSHGRRARVLSVGDRRFHFHAACLNAFKDHNPKTWLKNLEDAAQRHA